MENYVYKMWVHGYSINEIDSIRGDIPLAWFRDGVQACVVQDWYQKKSSITTDIDLEFLIAEYSDIDLSEFIYYAIKL